MTQKWLYAGLVFLFGCLAISTQGAEPPEWAIAECRGLKAWTEVVYRWIDRQAEDGSFGFGLNDDCEFYEMWPILVFAADDQKVLESLRRAVDWVWYNDHVQDGYHSGARDAAHAGEVTSCTTPLLTIADYGNPILIERMMITAKNVERWTAVNWRGHRHFRSNFFGSQEIYTHAYYGSDATVNGRPMIPAMHVLWYNQDSDLARYCIEWARSWLDHAKETKHGKPYGLLPAEIVFETDEPAGFTKVWCTGGIISYNQRFRMHQMFITLYNITGDPDFLLPPRTEMKFFGQINKGQMPEGFNMRRSNSCDKVGIEVQRPDGEWEKVRYDRVGSEIINYYRFATGDHQFDRWWGTFPTMTRENALKAGSEAVSMAEEQAQKAKVINVMNGTDNYEASIDQIGRYFPYLYYGTQHSSTDITDFPFPPVRWLKGNYELAVVMLHHDQTRFKALCCNVADQTRNFGAQFFKLKRGTYRMTMGIDTNRDNQSEKVVRQDNVDIARGTKLFFNLERGHEYIFELEQTTEGNPWEPRADVAVCKQDIFCLPAAPEPGMSAELKVRVHNIGTVDAKEVDIRINELGSGNLIAEKTVAVLSRPRNMVPSHTTVIIPWKVGAKATGVRVIVDSGEVIEEIYEGNNTAEIALYDINEAPRAKRKIYLPEWYRLTLQDPVPTYTAPYIKSITLDGRIGEAEWQAAERRGPLTTKDGEKAQKPTYIRIAYGPDALYFGIESIEPNMELLKETAGKHDDRAFCADDALEIFIDTNLDKLTYYQFVSNTAGVMGEGRFYNFTLYNEPWECKIHKGKDFWSAEAKIPYSSIKSRAQSGQTWGINVCRNAKTFRMPESEEQRRQGWTAAEFIALSPTFSGYHVPGRFAEVTFGPKR